MVQLARRRIVSTQRSPLNAVTLQAMKKDLRRELRKLGTPIDFDKLQARGLLQKTVHGWQLLKPIRKLPDYVRAQVTGLTIRRSNGKESTVLHFSRRSARPHRLAEIARSLTPR